jgi:serine/threonine-protein kinase TTK/MPS1
VHSDLKPANFLLVGGNLKLIDFGIANSVPTDQTSILKDTPTGTLNYMSPEAVQMQKGMNGYKVKKNTINFKINICSQIPLKSDVWSLGCILYYMVYHRTPFQHIPHMYMKCMAITNPAEKIRFDPIDNPDCLQTMRLCLQRDYKKRPSVVELLKHQYVNKRQTQDAQVKIIMFYLSFN